MLAEMNQEGDKAGVAARVVVGKDLDIIAYSGQTASPGGSQEYPGQPIGEILAQDQEVVC